MRETIGLVGGRRLRRWTEVVGPRHDPYHRDLVEFASDWMLVSCSLAGLYVEADDRRYHEEDAEVWIRDYTGVGSNYWLWRIWGRYERARARAMGPAAYEAMRRMIEADERLLAYAI